ncbi:MAG: hypothetical protein RL748_1757 [Pseudomonadota bacterium]|jgi:hypothetical protein
MAYMEFKKLNKTQYSTTPLSMNPPPSQGKPIENDASGNAAAMDIEANQARLASHLYSAD